MKSSNFHKALILVVLSQVSSCSLERVFSAQSDERHLRVNHD